MNTFTRDDIIRMAKTAGFTSGRAGLGVPQSHLTDGPVDADWLTDAVARLVDLAQAAEREKWINGAAIRVPTATMEQELQKQYRMGNAAGVKDEREACAKLCEAEGTIDGAFCAQAIRARGTPRASSTPSTPAP